MKSSFPRVHILRTVGSTINKNELKKTYRFVELTDGRKFIYGSVIRVTSTKRND